MTTDEVAALPQAFADAAVRADQAGFDVVEVHAAHGYLLHQFLSPLANQRTDQYGGSFDNRTRLVVEVVDAVRAVWPDDKPLFVRLSATDWADGGWDVERDRPARRGAQATTASTSSTCRRAAPSRTRRSTVGPGYQVPFAARGARRQRPAGRRRSG